MSLKIASYSLLVIMKETIRLHRRSDCYKMDSLQIGDIVKTRYNSGEYIGKIIDDKRNFWLVEILAVVTHPTQGDLHNPGQVEGIAFPERKALAFREKTNARKRDTIPYNGEVEPYAASLKRAVEEMKQELKSEDTPFNNLSLERLESLETHYYEKIYE